MDEACRRATAENAALVDVLLSMPEVSEAMSDDELVALLKPVTYLDPASDIVDRALADIESQAAARADAGPRDPGRPF